MIDTIISTIWDFFIDIDSMSIVLWSIILFVFCLLLSWWASIKVCSVRWHHRYWKWSYYLSWLSMMGGAGLLISYFEFGILSYWVWFLLVSFLVWLLYFEAERRWFVFQPIMFLGFFVFIWWIFWWGSSYYLISRYADSSLLVLDESMLPTYSPWDVLLIQSMDKSTWVSDITTWDVISFKTQWSDTLIKRVIWLDNQIVLLKNDDVEVCILDPKWCAALEEPYIQWSKTTALCDKRIFKVKEWFFVLSDNRKDMSDSRCCFDGECHEGEDTLVRTEEIRGVVTQKIDKKRSLIVVPLLELFGI